MAPQSSKYRRHGDDPSTYDHVHDNLPPKSRNRPNFEYVGTDSPRSSLSPHHRPPRRLSRTASPPRHSRHDEAYATAPHHTRQPSRPRSKDRDREQLYDSARRPDLKNRRHDLAEHNPKLQRDGKRGVNWAHVAANERKEATDPRSSPQLDREARNDRSRRHHRRHSPSPSPSPSPPRRPHFARTDGRDDEWGIRRHQQRRYSASPPPLNRDPDSNRASRQSLERERAMRQHGRQHSPSPSRRPRRGRDRSTSRPSRRRNTTAPPTKATADRWQAAARAALKAGGLTAFRLRKEPGGWNSDKTAKIVTAALGAAAADAFKDRDPRESPSGGGIKGAAESAIGNLIGAQIGPKSSPRRAR